MKDFIYKFYDDKDRLWRVYYDEINTPLAPFFSNFTGNYLSGDDGDYEVSDIEVELKSLSGKKKRILNLTRKEAMNYIESQLFDPEIEEY